MINEIQNFKRFSYNWMMKRKRQFEHSAFEKFRKRKKESTIIVDMCKRIKIIRPLIFFLRIK